MDNGAVEICDLPVVSLKQGDAAAAIVDACRSHGFFVLQEHGITLVEELFAQSKAFFDLPRDIKDTIKAAPTLRGYSAPGAEVLDPEHQRGFESKVRSTSKSSLGTLVVFARGADACVQYTSRATVITHCVCVGVVCLHYHVLFNIAICRRRLT
jgi:non-haem dioxygenase in morphine synthesis N-terminal